MNIEDEIDGGEGTDTLTVRMDANDQFGVISNVENIEIIARGDNGAAPTSFVDVSGATNVTLKDGTSNYDLTAFDQSVALTFENADDVYTVAYADLTGAADSQALTVDGFDGEFALGTTGLETLAITGANNASEFTVTDHANATIETISIAGSADVNMTLAAATDAVETIDASAATGDVTVTVAANGILSVTGGSGDDSFELGTTLGATDEIDGGAGDDELQGTIAAAATMRVNAVNIETLDIDFTAAGTLDLRLTNAVATLDLSGSTAAMAVTQASALLESVVFTADSNADFNIDYANGVTGNLTVTIGDSDDGDGEGVDTGDFTTDATSLTVASIGDDANTIDTVTANTATSVSFTTANADATLNAGNLTADSATSISLSAVGGDLTVGTYIDADTLESLTLSASGAANLTVGDIGTDGDAGAAFALSALVVTMGTGDLDLGEVHVSTDDAAGVALDTVSITSAGESIQFQDGAAAIEGTEDDEDAALSSITITATADDVDLDVGTIEVASVDEVTFTLSGEDGDGDIDTITATTFGDLTVTTGEDTNLNIEEIAADEIGNITLTAAIDGVITLDDLDVNGTVGTIVMSGAGQFDIDITDADSVGDIDASATDEDSTVDVNAAGVQDDVVITFGEGTNTYTASVNDDEITLADGAGTDTIITAASAGSITISNFEAGAAGDEITVDISGIVALTADTDEIVHIVNMTDEIAAADAVVFHTATIATATTRDLDNATAASNILVLNGTFASSANVIDGTVGIATGGAFALTLGDTLTADDGFLVMWDDGVNSYLSLVINADGDADGATMAAASLSITNLITFIGIDDVTDITAANFNAFA